MSIINIIKFSKINLINLFISLLPLCLIIGNSFTNVNLIIICILGFLIFGKDIFNTNNRYYYLLYIFFIYIFVISVLNYLPLINEWSIYKTNIFKSLFFIRFLIFFLVISKLVEKKLFNFNLFFVVSSLLSIAVALDLFYQLFFKVNLFNFKITAERPSGFFNKENIAGGYLQRFSFFFICGCLILNSNFKSKYILLFFIFFFLAILITNNRMPLLIFILMVFLYFLLQKEIRKYFFIYISILVLFFSVVIKENDYLKLNYLRLYGSVKEMIIYAPKLFYYNELERPIGNYNSYLLTFNGAVQLIKKNYFFGSGIKSFRINSKYEKVNGIRVSRSGTHPHNYLLEIVLDTGLIGLFLIYGFTYLITIRFYYFYKNNNDIKQKMRMLPFFLIIFFEFFPIRSSGSFFTTGNSIIIFLALAIISNLSIKNSKE